MTEIEPLTYGSDRLIRQWRERYTGRRSDRPPLSPMAIVQQDLDAAWQRLQRLAAYRRLHPIAGTYA